MIKESICESLLGSLILTTKGALQFKTVSSDKVAQNPSYLGNSFNFSSEQKHANAFFVTLIA